jgi:ferredoxin--NADP+ reductase
MLLQDYDITTRYQAKVLSNERITEAASKEDVREILIEVEHPDFHAWIGQNIGVLAPGRREIGQEHHFRLYSVADLPQKTAAGQQLCICVRRCSYIDQFSGEEYPGIASNYLCDLSPGDTITVTGPYGQAFELPEDHHATLILIGAGRGIAHFRGFLKYIYTNHA